MSNRSRRYAVAALLAPASLVACGPSQTPAASGTTDVVAAPPAALRETAAGAVRPAGPERLVLAFGDSLYAGYGVARGQSLPDAVQARLWRDGVNATLVNAGVSGDTTAAGRQRLAFALDNLPRRPDLVLLGLGGNDVLRQIAPAETRANLTAILDLLKARGIPVLMTGMLAPPNLGPAYREDFDRIWPDLARRYDAGLYPFILDGVIGDAALMQADSVHPNAAGIARIADRLTPRVAERLPGKDAAGG